jgi:hypothetical protein
LLGDPVFRLVALGVVLGLGIYVHFTIRKMAAKHLMTTLQHEVRTMSDGEFWGGVIQAFRHNTRWWRSIFRKQPVGWGPRARRLLKEILTEANYYVQELNNKFANPSGTNRPVTSSTDAAPVTEKVSAP